MSVQKYIETAERSPQNSNLKRHEKPHRKNLKSPKKLETLFKNASPSVKNNDNIMHNKENFENNSMEDTPLIEIVKIGELNDSDPICPELINCDEPIALIASELSSPAMKYLLIKELQGKIDTIADFAKLTELEVNRLCIKAPKVEVAKEVLKKYLTKLNTNHNEEFNESYENNTSLEPNSTTLYFDAQVQTSKEHVIDNAVQTDDTILNEKQIQTHESSFISTDKLITNYIEQVSNYTF